jgi:hypothetical protein
MGSEEEQRNRMLAGADHSDARIRERNKRLIRTIIGMIALGGAIVFIDNITRDKGALVPIDFKDQKGTVTNWRSIGFVKSIDEASAEVVVDEAEWKRMSVGERRAVVMLLASYCAARNQKPDYRLTVKGDVSQKPLASVDDKSVNVD